MPFMKKVSSETALTADLAVAFQKQRAIVGRAPAEMDLGRLAAARQEFTVLDEEMGNRIRDHITATPDPTARAQVEAIATALRAYADGPAKVFELAQMFAQEDALQHLSGPVAEAQGAVDRVMTTVFENARRAMPPPTPPPCKTAPARF